jgi:hypothetical protein
MGKRVTLTLLQFIAFLGLMFVGGNWDVVNLQSEIRQMQAGNLQPHVLIPTIKTQISATHLLIANGIIYTASLFILILLIEAVSRRLKPWASLSFLAFILAVVIAYSLKMGLPPV